MADVYTILASLLKYIFITIIYLFIFGIIRMIFLDIRKSETAHKKNKLPKGMASLELMAKKDSFYFNVNNVYPLDKDVIVIGRGAKCNISIDDLYMSTQHAQLWHEDDEWYIADMGSTNGTYVNSKKMKEKPLILDDGDVIKVGQVEFLVVI